MGKAAVGEESVAIAGRWVEESDTARPEGSWHEHDEGVHVGCERFFLPSYNGNLVAAWLPALDGVTEKLRVGATVADVGCGLGASTRLMAEAFPRSKPGPTSQSVGAAVSATALTASFAAGAPES